jgi:hypothetical protein
MAVRELLTIFMDDTGCDLGNNLGNNLVLRNLPYNPSGLDNPSGSSPSVANNPAAAAGQAFFLKEPPSGRKYYTPALLPEMRQLSKIVDIEINIHNLLASGSRRLPRNRRRKLLGRAQQQIADYNLRYSSHLPVPPNDRDRLAQAWNLSWLESRRARQLWQKASRREQKNQIHKAIQHLRKLQGSKPGHFIRYIKGQLNSKPDFLSPMEEVIDGKRLFYDTENCKRICRQYWRNLFRARVNY